MGHLYSGGLRRVRSAASIGFDCRGQRNASHLLANACQDCLRHSIRRNASECFCAGTGEFEYSPGRRARCFHRGYTHSPSTFTPADTRELFRGTGHRVDFCRQGKIQPFIGWRRLLLSTARSSASRNFVPRLPFRDCSSTSPTWVPCLRQESMNCWWFSPQRTLWATRYRKTCVSLTVIKATPAVGGRNRTRLFTALP